GCLSWQAKTERNEAVERRLGSKGSGLRHFCTYAVALARRIYPAWLFTVWHSPASHDSTTQSFSRQAGGVVASCSQTIAELTHHTIRFTSTYTNRLFTCAMKQPS